MQVFPGHVDIMIWPAGPGGHLGDSLLILNCACSLFVFALHVCLLSWQGRMQDNKGVRAPQRKEIAARPSFGNFYGSRSNCTDPCHHYASSNVLGIRTLSLPSKLSRTKHPRCLHDLLPLTQVSLSPHSRVRDFCSLATRVLVPGALVLSVSGFLEHNMRQ